MVLYSIGDIAWFAIFSVSYVFVFCFCFQNINWVFFSPCQLHPCVWQLYTFSIRLLWSNAEMLLPSDQKNKLLACVKFYVSSHYIGQGWDTNWQGWRRVALNSMQLLSVRLCLSIAAVEEDQGTSNQWCVECFQCNNAKMVFFAFSA